MASPASRNAPSLYYSLKHSESLDRTSLSPALESSEDVSPQKIRIRASPSASHLDTSTEAEPRRTLQASASLSSLASSNSDSSTSGRRLFKRIGRKSRQLGHHVHQISPPIANRHHRVAVLEQSFYWLDSRCKGFMNLSDLEKVAEERPHLRLDVPTLWKDMCAHASGEAEGGGKLSISLTEFFAFLMKDTLEYGTEAPSMKCLFSIWDGNASGGVGGHGSFTLTDFLELQQRSARKAMSPQQCEQLFNVLDVNKQGCVGYAHFVQFLVVKPSSCIHLPKRLCDVLLAKLKGAPTLKADAEITPDHPTETERDVYSFAWTALAAAVAELPLQGKETESKKYQDRVKAHGASTSKTSVILGKFAQAKSLAKRLTTRSMTFPSLSSQCAMVRDHVLLCKIKVIDADDMFPALLDLKVLVALYPAATAIEKFLMSIGSQYSKVDSKK